MRVLFATAELAPVTQVGGLGIAAAGLVRALRELGIDVIVALPDYFALPLEDEEVVDLDVPSWAAPASARFGLAEQAGPVALVDVPAIARPHPYLRADGAGWPDNDRRFFAFSVAVGALAEELAPDILHLNDWHSAAVLAQLADPPPSVLTVHTLGYQGISDVGWVGAFDHHHEAYRMGGAFNPLAGGLRLADLVVAVSPTYAREIRTPAGGFGLDGVLRARGHDLVGIRNGIDTVEWDPATDRCLVENYDAKDVAAKDANRAAVRAELGLQDSPGALVVMVSRLVAQKGVDLALAASPFLRGMPAQLAILGSGDSELANAIESEASRVEELAFRRGYDEGLARRLFAGGDLLLMPSRFEPCGLAQMQAMRYGALPVATDVGGLHDTVIDVDDDPRRGTGTLAARPTELDVLDALHRGLRAYSGRARRTAMRRRGMTADWSWHAPASEHLEHYQRLSRA